LPAQPYDVLSCLQVLERDSLNFEKNVNNDYAVSIVVNAYKLLLAQGVKEENLQAVLMTHVSLPIPTLV